MNYQPLSVELGPGILGNIFDGIQVCVTSHHVVFQILTIHLFLISSFNLNFEEVEAIENNCKEIRRCLHSSWCCCPGT